MSEKTYMVAAPANFTDGNYSGVEIKNGQGKATEAQAIILVQMSGFQNAEITNILNKRAKEDALISKRFLG